jgi:hypothetical protein
LGIGDHCHDHGQCRTNRCDYVADPVHQVEYGAFRLRRSLALYRLTSSRRSSQILAVANGEELQKNYCQQASESSPVPKLSPTQVFHNVLFPGARLWTSFSRRRWGT